MSPRALLVLYHLIGLLPLAGGGLAALFSRRWREGLAERLGAGGAVFDGREETIWIHGASVGEILAAEGIVAGLLKARPRGRIVISAFTVSGREAARKKFGAFGERVAFTLLPLDWGGAPGRALDRFRPSLFVILETELWPMLIHTLSVRGVPLMIANGRLSKSGYSRYRRLRWFFAPFLKRLALLCVRTGTDGGRFRQLGVPAEKIRLAGNIKHDGQMGEAQPEKAEAWRNRLREAGKEKVMVAGSLRRGEEGAVLEAFTRLRESFPGLRLVIAPRHPDTFDEAKLAATGLPWERWSETADGGPGESAAIVLLDTLGELKGIYALADLAFVGGTLDEGEGHNILEPALASVPVLFGPGYRGYQEEGDALLESGGGFLAADADAIFSAAATLLRDDGAREEAGRSAGETAGRFGGALAVTLTAIEELLPERSA